MTSGAEATVQILLTAPGGYPCTCWLRGSSGQQVLEGVLDLVQWAERFGFGPGQTQDRKEEGKNEHEKGTTAGVVQVDLREHA